MEFISTQTAGELDLPYMQAIYNAIHSDSAENDLLWYEDGTDEAFLDTFSIWSNK